VGQIRGLVVILALTASGFGLSPSCPSVPTLVVDDFVIEGVAIKGEQLLRSAQVSLYSQGKLVRRVATDEAAHFTLDHLSPGAYRLSIHGLGSFEVKVVATAVETLKQRRHYGFSKARNGCLSWGFSTD
jgi:hypothetical protein